MAIDLRKNKDSLTNAYNRLVDNKDDTNWIIFGYEGQTPVLKVVETGDGGIEEMAEDLSSGKMLYAYCSVKDPNTDLFKYVLIHWTGESVPENVKLKYTSHLRDVQAFLKAVHVTVTARTETDIDEDDIVKKVSKASGANYSIHKEKAKPEEAPAPVGTDYKRVRPDREINLNERDKFWSQTEKDEINRQKENKFKMEEERKHLEAERKEREQQEAKQRDRRIADRMKEVTVQKEAEKKAEQKRDQDDEKRRWAQVQKESSIDEEERGHRSDQIRKERMAEAQKLTSSSTAKSRDFFKQKSTERPEISNRGPPPPRKIRPEFGSKADENQPPARKEPIQLPKEDPAPSFHEPPQPDPQPDPQPEATSPPTRDLLRESLPPRQESDPEEDQDWDEPPEEDFTFREHRVPSVTDHSEEYHPDTQSRRMSSTQKYPDEEEETNEVENSRETYEVESNNNPTGGGGDEGNQQGVCAKAIYDYQAADDTEITFDPDDIITNIEMIDDGWWQGFGPDGSYGMFPANYVELIE